MISFVLADYFFASASALLYGMIFSLFECFCRCLVFFSRAFYQAVFDGIFYKERITKIQRYSSVDPTFTKPVCEIFSAVKVVLFFLGLNILSYIMLDGEFRLFAAIISFVGFFCGIKVFVRSYSQAF